MATVTTPTPIAVSPPAATRFMLPVVSLWTREVKRFARQKSRVAGVLISPLVFWLFLGLGFGRSFSPPGDASMGYLEYFYPGTVLLIVLFTAIFSTISIIEDRREGFLQSVVVSPASPLAISLGKILGGTTVALAQGVILLVLARPAGIPIGLAEIVPSLAILFVVGFGLTGLGFLMAWRMDSSQGFHAVMNLLFVPMWMLSGAVFPVDGAPAWLGWVMRLNPVTYGLTAFRHAMYPGTATTGPLPGPEWCVAISVVFAIAMWLASAHAARTLTSTARRKRPKKS